MLPITVCREDGRRHVRVSVGELAELVGGIGAGGDLFLVVQRIPDLPNHFLQVWHMAGDDYYQLEHRDGGHDRHHVVFVDTPDPVADVVAAMAGWARGEEGWGDGLAWERLKLRAPKRVRPLKLDDHERARLEGRVRELLVGGYATRAQLVEAAERFPVSGWRRRVSPEQAWELVDRMWLERLAEQARWEGETDPERLTGAFAALERAGITAREDFAATGSPRDSGIRAVGAPDARGFVYFHSGCTDSAAAGRGLPLFYGGFDGSSGTTTAIGREVVAALAAAGLPSEWDGDPDDVITVTPMDWRKRLVG
ncbi:DUF6891 domain-containing protein [Actinacidiphila glaucinigra]|uniref:DUF6891 domain-containing protein n=1 Tax=Actinacidiphila glaucinigra TaxID=235986 RepID=A0A238ZH81_9ACTN|nr:hypothetical protein [Actinacidiphila glaucinigra]SNR82835.1 hypothetical protein SAMN05216252_101292 [Actinacidiphila glaucinigra]